MMFAWRFPDGHPKAGQRTYFPEKIVEGIDAVPEHYFKNVPLTVADFQSSTAWPFKYHTIREGNNWKEGETFSPRVWAGIPHRSQQIEFTIPLTIIKTWSFEVKKKGYFINGKLINLVTLNFLAANDGMELSDFRAWFPLSKPFKGQIITWDKHIKY